MKKERPVFRVFLERMLTAGCLPDRSTEFSEIYAFSSLRIQKEVIPSSVVVAKSRGQWLFRNFGASSARRMVVDSLMTLGLDADVGVVDPVEEMRLRTWARKNYTPMEERDENWHPIVLDEMDRKDQESDLMAVLS
jgi:hypothetical protein